MQRINLFTDFAIFVSRPCGICLKYNSMKTSQAQFRAVVNGVLELEVTKGHLKWKVSELARKAKVSRPLVYYYLGKTKVDILESTLDLIAEELYGLSSERVAMVQRGDLLQSLQQTRRMLEQTPALAVFYQKWRFEKSPLQAKLVKMEKRYQQKLKGLFPQFNDVQIQALHAVFHGLIVAPFVTEASLRVATSGILKGLSSQLE